MGGSGLSELGVPLGVTFSLSLARFSSSVAVLYRFLSDLGRGSNPARFVPDFVFFGFLGDTSRNSVVREDPLSPLPDRKGSFPNTDFVGERALFRAVASRLSSPGLLEDRRADPW